MTWPAGHFLQSQLHIGSYTQIDSSQYNGVVYDVGAVLDLVFLGPVAWVVCPAILIIHRHDGSQDDFTLSSMAFLL